MRESTTGFQPSRRYMKYTFQRSLLLPSSHLLRAQSRCSLARETRLERFTRLCEPYVKSNPHQKGNQFHPRHSSGSLLPTQSQELHNGSKCYSGAMRTLRIHVDRQIRRRAVEIYSTSHQFSQAHFSHVSIESRENAFLRKDIHSLDSGFDTT